MITTCPALATISIVCDDPVMAAPRELSPSSRTLTVTLTPAQVAALAHAVFTDTSARPAVEKNASEAAVRKLQAEARRAGG